MMLGDLIERLEKESPDTVLRLGFARPHSYRGYYDQLAFEPREAVTVGSMLAAAKEALGKTYQGYKGGDYTMGGYTDCWLAEYGTSGEELGARLLDYMLKDTQEPTR